VLGVIFNWAALAQRIIENTPLSEEEKANSRICIVDHEGLILADSRKKVLESHIQFSGMESLLSEKKGFVLSEYENEESCIGHAFSPGYETYSSGWHSVIIQKIKRIGRK
ncbi:MAG: chemotaxis protein, partial [Nitrososphaera sp.]|nr:chemotaxis protein [Nitrososphaera sp.]